MTTGPNDFLRDRWIAAQSFELGNQLLTSFCQAKGNPIPTEDFYEPLRLLVDLLLSKCVSADPSGKDSGASLGSSASGEWSPAAGGPFGPRGRPVTSGGNARRTLEAEPTREILSRLLEELKRRREWSEEELVPRSALVFMSLPRQYRQLEDDIGGGPNAEAVAQWRYRLHHTAWTHLFDPYLPLDNAAEPDLRRVGYLAPPEVVDRVKPSIGHCLEALLERLDHRYSLPDTITPKATAARITDNTYIRGFIRNTLRDVIRKECRVVGRFDPVRSDAPAIQSSEVEEPLDWLVSMVRTGDPWVLKQAREWIGGLTPKLGLVFLARAVYDSAGDEPARDTLAILLDIKREVKGDDPGNMPARRPLVLLTSDLPAHVLDRALEARALELKAQGTRTAPLGEHLVAILLVLVERLGIRLDQQPTVERFYSWRRQLRDKVEELRARIDPEIERRQELAD